MTHSYSPRQCRHQPSPYEVYQELYFRDRLGYLAMQTYTADFEEFVSRPAKMLDTVAFQAAGALQLGIVLSVTDNGTVRVLYSTLASGGNAYRRTLRRRDYSLVNVIPRKTSTDQEIAA